MSLKHTAVSEKLNTIHMLNEILLGTNEPLSQPILPPTLKTPLIGLGLTIPLSKSQTSPYSDSTLVKEEEEEKEEEKEWLMKFASTDWLADDTSTLSDTLSVLALNSVIPDQDQTPSTLAGESSSSSSSPDWNAIHKPLSWDDSDINWSKTLLAYSPMSSPLQPPRRPPPPPTSPPTSPPPPPPVLHSNGLTPEQTAREINFLVKMHREFLESYQNQDRTEYTDPALNESTLHELHDVPRHQGMLDKNSRLLQALRNAIPPPPPTTTRGVDGAVLRNAIPPPPPTISRDVDDHPTTLSPVRLEHTTNQMPVVPTYSPDTSGHGSAAIPSICVFKPSSSSSPTVPIGTTTTSTKQTPHGNARRFGGRVHVNPMFLDSVVMRDTELVELIKMLMHVNEDGNRSSQLFV